MATPCPAVVIGAGPAGLATAACLKGRGIEPTVLEAGPSVGSSWRNHYRRLHLHTVKEYSSLPGLPFPTEVRRYPSRLEVVAYLEAYAARFGIAPRTNEPVRCISVVDGTLAVESASGLYHSTVVVVAAGINRVPNPDRLADQALFQGTVVHAGGYQDGANYAGQRVLVVGAGNTGAEVALDLAEHGARPTMSVRTPVNIVARDFLGVPAQVTGLRTRWIPIPIGDRLGRLISRLAFGDLTRYGLLRPELGPLSSIARRGRIPIIDVGTVEAIKRGAIAIKPAVTRLTTEGAEFVDGTYAPVDAVIMATGYDPGLKDLIDIAGVLDAAGDPKGWKAGGQCRGLYFVGYGRVATGLLREIGLQAEAVADDVATNVRPPGTD